MYNLYYVPIILYDEPFLIEVMKLILTSYKVWVMLDRFEQELNLPKIFYSDGVNAGLGSSAE